MRIAVLAHSFPRFRGDTHGPFVEDLSAALARRGHEVTVLVPYDPALRTASDGRETPLDIRSFRYIWPDAAHLLGYSRTLAGDVRMKVSAWLESPLYFLFAELALRRLLRGRRIDVVHAHWILPNGYVAARACAAAGTPFAVTLHGSDVFIAERNALFRRMARRALEASAYVTSCSPDLTARLARLSGVERRRDEEEKIRLVPNGTEVAAADAGAVEGAELRARLGVGRDTPLVAAVGRMVPKKGFGHLVAAAPAVLAAVPRARIVIAGDGPERSELRRRARELGLDARLLLPGALSHPDVLGLMAAADLFVMPSVRDEVGNVDGLPIVVLEAMASGLAVVASDIAGIPLAVEDGATGRLVPPGDAEALATAVRELLGDSERRRRMGTAGRRRIEEELNWDAVAARHEELLSVAVDGSAERGVDVEGATGSTVS